MKIAPTYYKTLLFTLSVIFIVIATANAQDFMDILRKPTDTDIEELKPEKPATEKKQESNGKKFSKAKSTDNKKAQKNNDDDSTAATSRGVRVLDGKAENSIVGSDAVRVKLGGDENTEAVEDKKEDKKNAKQNKKNTKKDKNAKKEQAKEQKQKAEEKKKPLTIEEQIGEMAVKKNQEEENAPPKISPMPNVNLDFPSISFDEPDIYYGNSADSNFNEKEELENSNPYQANTSAQSNNSAKSKKVPTTIIELSNTEKSNTEESNNQTNEYQFEDNSPQAAATDAFADNLPAAISNLIAKHQVNKENFSLIIQEVSRDKPLASLNAGKLRSPASVTKIFTTAAGLIAMGDDYRYPTRFFVDAMPDKDGIVNGNLYIQGGGDPFLVEERLRDFIKELRGKGVRHIAGNIIIDNSLYKLDLNEKDTFGFDGNQYSAYNAVPSPIMVNFRTIKIIFTPAGKKGVNISLSPQINNWQIDNQMTINSGKCSENFNPTPELSRDDKGFAVLRLTGKYSTNCGKSDISVVMGEAVEQMYYLFRDLWYAEGGSFDGRGEIGVVPNSAELIYTGQSLPMSELVQKMNTMSNNVMTRQLMLTLGAYLYDVPGNLEKGRKGVLETLTAFGVATDGAVLDNGSGLSRKTRISAQGFSSLLINMYRSEKLREPFWNSLAVCGETGTLKKRFKGTAMQGKIRGKTGTIDKVRGFAGYVQAQSGRVFVVVMIGNNNAALPSRYMQDDVLSWVYQQ